MSKEDSIIGEGFSQGANLLKGILSWGVIPAHWYYNLMIITFNVNVFLLFFIEIGKVGQESIMFLSGMFLTMGVFRGEESKTHSWKSWYKKRLIRIYPNLIIGVFVNLFLLFFLFGEQHDMNTILLSLSGLQSVPINPAFWGIITHYWFFTLIISCYLIFPFFYYLIKKQFKLMVILSIILYICFVVFFDTFNSISQYIMYVGFGHKLNLWWYSLLTPRYFSFFFGMLFGFWIGQNEIKKINIFQNRQKTKLILFILITFFFLLHLYLLSFLIPIGTRGFFSPNTFYSKLAKTLTFPAMGILLTILILMIFNEKPKVNRILEIPGKELFEVILFHSVPLALNTYIISIIGTIPKADLWAISLPMIFITAFLLAYPFYRFGEWVKREKNIHFIILVIGLSFFIYGVISNLLFFLHITQLKDIFYIILFNTILIIVVISSSIHLMGI
ncbi:MAG: acyltransferase family protein [Candidatus Thorarchaeota archaeon]